MDSLFLVAWGGLMAAFFVGFLAKALASRPHWTMRHRYRVWTTLPPEEARRRLQEAHRASELSLDVFVDHLRIKTPIRGRNSWRPVLHCRLQAAGVGTLIEVDATIDPLVRIFTFVHSLLLFGIGWLMGVGGFSAALPEARRVLRTTVAGTDFELDEPIPMRVEDPTTVGAERGAPASLRAEVFEDHAAFRLDGSATTTLRVDALAVTVGDHRVTWDELAEVELVAGEELHLAFVGGTRFSVPVGDHPRQDLDWLVTYLMAVDERHGSPTEAVDAAKVEARRLARLKAGL